MMYLTKLKFLINVYTGCEYAFFFCCMLDRDQFEKLYQRASAQSMYIGLALKVAHYREEKIDQVDI